MTKSEKQRSTNMKTFRFGSSQVLPLTDRVIQQIPYLLGLVSFAEHTSTGFDDDGHIKLDPIVNFRHFCIIIDTLPFQSLSQALFRLPKHEGLAAIMILIDYLGLIPMPYPTLNEIDAVFLFASHNKHRGEHGGGETIEADLVQNMAAYFVLGLVRNEYDYRDVGVISQIQWCTMFIIQADKLFDPILRYQVQKATEYYFYTFRPTLVHTLVLPSPRTKVDKKRISCRVRKELFSPDYNQFDPGNELTPIYGPHAYIYEYRSLDYLSLPFMSWRAWYCHFYNRRGWSWISHDDDLYYESRRKKIKLFSAVEQFAYSVSVEIFKIFEIEIWPRFADNNSDVLSARLRPTDLSQSKIRQLDLMSDNQIKIDILQAIFEKVSVQQRIRTTITERLPDYVCQMEKKYNNLVEDLRTLSQTPMNETDVPFGWWRYFLTSPERKMEQKKKEMLECQENLMKFRQVNQVTDEICSLVMLDLYQLGIDLIRHIVHLQSVLPNLKAKENLTKSNDRRIKTLTIMSKPQKNSIYKPLPKLPMRKHHNRH